MTQEAESCNAGEALPAQAEKTLDELMWELADADRYRDRDMIAKTQAAIRAHVKVAVKARLIEALKQSRAAHIPSIPEEIRTSTEALTHEFARAVEKVLDQDEADEDANFGERKYVPLTYSDVLTLYFSFRRGDRRFILHHPGRQSLRVSYMTLGDDFVWVKAGDLPGEYLRADGSSNSDPRIWLEERPN